MNDIDFYAESSADLIALETDPVRKELLQRIQHNIGQDSSIYPSRWR